MSSTEPETRRFERRHSERWIAGVCAGLARHLGVDPTLVRIVTAVLVVVSGGGALIGYAAFWLFVPDEGEEHAIVHRGDRRGALRSLRVLVGTILIVASAVGVVVAATGGSARVDVLIAVAVVAIGVTLIAAAPFGGGRVLIPLGLLLAASSGVAAAANLDLRGGVGDRELRPTTRAAVQREYRLAVGQITLDLREVPLGGAPVHVRVDVAMGHAVVRLPAHVAVAVRGTASGGDVRVLGHRSSGLDAATDAENPGRPVLVLDTHVGFGAIDVVRGDAPVAPR